MHFGLLPAEVDDGGAEEHGLVVGVRHDEEDPLYPRDHLEPGVGSQVGEQAVAHQAEAQDGRQEQGQLLHDWDRTKGYYSFPTDYRLGSCSH